MSDTEKTTDPRERTIEQFNADYLARNINTIAKKLREVADAAERQAKQVATVGQPGRRATYASIATEVQHDVLWGLANLHLDQLVTSATDADLARAAGE